MKHTKGNTPKCYECYYYREAEKVINRFGGWCSCPHNLYFGINGKKRAKPLTEYAVRADGECTWWEDAEDRTTHYEVMTASTVANSNISDCATQRKEQKNNHNKEEHT